MRMVVIVGMLGACDRGAVAQQRLPPVSPATATGQGGAPVAAAQGELLDRLRYLEQRLDWEVRQNRWLASQTQALANKVDERSQTLRGPLPTGLEANGVAATHPMHVASRPGESPRTIAAAGFDRAESVYALPAVEPADGACRNEVESMLTAPANDATALPWLARGDSFLLGSGRFDYDRPQTAGGGSKASGGDPTVQGRAQIVGNRHAGKLELNSHYDFDHDGFGWSTKDSEYTFGIRGMTQIDARMYSPAGQNVANSGLYNPRSRIYFEGHLTKPIKYEFSYQNSFDNVKLLDAYINFDYDPRLQVRFGRYKTPFTYEYYRTHIWDLMAPERSLFANNYEGNRRFGAMIWGTVAERRVEYAVGSFNTQRNSYQPFSNRQDVMAFLNFKLFYNREEGFLLRDLQFGGSVDAGTEDQPTVPAVLRTNIAPGATGINDNAAANSASLPFLAFNPGVKEMGTRALWEAHLAYYYNGLSFLTAIEGGHESYAATGGPSTRVPIRGWVVQAAYILTGETIRDRTLVDPLNRFDLRQGRFGLGAWEVSARYSELTLDRRVFTNGLADANLWTNNAKLIDVGVNWYLNKFTKIYFDWEHAIFASPVLLNPGQFERSNDLFWIRTQLYF